MSCEQVEYALEHHGPDGLTRELHRHVDRCAHCRQVVNALQVLEDSLRALPVPPASTGLSSAPMALHDDADVVAERRAEAARLDWLQTVQRVEIVPPRRRFGVPRAAARLSLPGQLALGALAAAVLFTVGLIAAVIWNDLESASSPPVSTFTPGDSRGGTVEPAHDSP